MHPGTVQLADGEFHIECAPHVAIKLRRMFGGVQRLRAGKFRLSATPANAYELEWFRKRYALELIGGSERAFKKLVRTEQRRIDSIGELEATSYVPREFSLALPPREYQRVAADLALRTGALLIADEPGVGKTVSSICTMAVPGTLPALVVTMTHLPMQWERELGRFMPGLRVHRIKSGQPYDLAKPQFYLDPKTGKRKRDAGGMPDVIVINYHKLDGWTETLASICKTVIYDECQELRHEGSNKYVAARSIAEAMALKIGLSATPIYNYGAEIYSVLDVVSPGSLGTRKEFYDEWCGGVNPTNDQDVNKVCVADPVALGTYLRESGLMIRRTRKDVGRELPALTIVRHTVDVDHTRINEAVASVAELARRVLERTGTSFERMQWSGEIDYRMRQATGIGKAPAVADFVRLLVESGERVVLYGWHHEVYAIWRSVLAKHGITFAMYTGEENERQKAESVKAFIAGTAQVLIISLRAGAGLDGLQAVCRTVVTGELDWSPKVHEQNVTRVYRDGQPDPCVVYYLVSDHGSDPVIADVLGLKEAQSTGIIDPERAGVPHLVGASDDHIRKLAEDILRRSQNSPPAGDQQLELGVESPLSPPPIPGDVTPNHETRNDA